MKKEFVIYVYTAQQEGLKLTHFGTLRGALRVAKKFAKDAFPTWIKGYGPRIAVQERGENEATRYQL